VTPPPDSLAGLLGDVVAKLGVTAALDVGANRGDFARLLRDRAAFGGRIVSFEPQREVFERLAAETAADPRWEARRLAVGAADTTQTLRRFAGSELASLWAMNDDGRRLLHGSPERGEEEVEVRTLAGLWDELALDRERVLLKADTQGFELEVLAGAGSRLDEIVALVLEVAVTPLYAGTPDWRTVIDATTEAGFVPSGLYLVNRAPDLRAIEFDYVAVRPRLAGKAAGRRDG
jgi:FkbM family methyltransferase